MRLYLGNKMVGVQDFGEPWFDETEAWLRTFPWVTAVFNPARRDRATGFNLAGNAGTHDELRAAGFDRPAALIADWTWIARTSTGMIAGPQWRDSPGTISEVACHQALYLPVWEYEVFHSIVTHPSFTSANREVLEEHALTPLLELDRYAAAGQPG